MKHLKHSWKRRQTLRTETDVLIDTVKHIQRRLAQTDGFITVTLFDTPKGATFGGLVKASLFNWNAVEAMRVRWKEIPAHKVFGREFPEAAT
jgi:hypothetical protein